MTKYNHKKSSVNRVKRAARQEYVEIYKRLTGRTTLKGQYWTLCNRQPKVVSEIGQFVRGGFLTPEQFHGVDRDEAVIEANREDWPSAHWYAGEFGHVVDQVKDFAPGIVYLDGVSMLDNPTFWRLAFSVMYDCPAECLFVVNGVETAYGLLANPRVTLKDAIEDAAYSGWHQQWEILDGYRYRSSVSNMVTWLFFRSV